MEADAMAIEDLRAAGAEGPFGPFFAELDGDPEAAIARLKSEQRGEVPAAVVRDGIGEIALVWGTDRFALKHILARRPELEARIPDLLRSGEWHPYAGGLKRAFLVSTEDPAHVAVIRLDWDGVDKNWLVTTYRDDWGKFARDQKESYRTGLTDARNPASSGQVKDSPAAATDQDPDPAAEIAAARAATAGLADLTFRLDEGGPELTVAELLDDIAADEDLAQVLKLCNIRGGGGQRNEASPHPRGYTPGQRANLAEVGGLPAPAGIHPSRPRIGRRATRLLRTRGDRPRSRRAEAPRVPASPHPRG